MILNPGEGSGLLTTVLAVVAVFIALKIFTEYKPGVFRKIEDELDGTPSTSEKERERQIEIEDVVAGINMEAEAITTDEEVRMVGILRLLQKHGLLK